MDFLVYLFYPLLFCLLLYKSKYIRNGWNEEFLTIEQSKACQGFFAVCIIFHHLSQKTAAPWIDPDYIVHGLDPFVNIGFLFVAVFFFFSGYGLLKSYKTKENYLNGFLSKHLFTLFLALVTSGIIFFGVRNWLQNDFSPRIFFTIGEPQQVNPYGWFALTLMLFYIFFYVSFKKQKSIKRGIAIIAVLVLLYSLYCDYALFGTWWYNSVWTFILGLIFAEYEKQIVEFLKKGYWARIIILAILTVVLIIISAQNSDHISRFVILCAQIIAAVTFTLAVLMVGMKLKVGNKALAFLGGFTLELYLIHGVFVQVFSHCVINEKSYSPYYIESLPLYILLVLVCSIPLAYGLHFLDSFIIKFFKNRPGFVKVFKRDVKRVFVVVLSVIVLFLVYTFFTSRQSSKAVAQDYDNFVQNNITFVEVDDHKMAAYVNGEGKHTIVLITPMAGTLTTKPMADDLAEKNKVIVLDLFGTGFSDVVDTPRTSENVVREINQALEQLAEGPYILFVHTSTGIYAQKFAQLYPEKLEAVIGMETELSEEFFEMTRARNLNKKEYNRIAHRVAEKQVAFYKLGNITGINSWVWALYELLFSRGWTETEQAILEEIYKRNIYNKVTLSQASAKYDNFKELEGAGYPEELPVYFMLGYDTCFYNMYYGDWEQYHRNQLTKSPLSDLTVIVGNPYALFWNYQNVRDFTQAFITKLDEAE